MNKFEFDNTATVNIHRQAEQEHDNGKTVVYINETPKISIKRKKWRYAICVGMSGFVLLAGACLVSYHIGKAHGTLIVDGKQYSIGRTGIIHNANCRDFNKAPLKNCKNCGGLKKL